MNEKSTAMFGALADILFDDAREIGVIHGIEEAADHLDCAIDEMADHTDKKEATEFLGYWAKQLRQIAAERRTRREE